MSYQKMVWMRYIHVCSFICLMIVCIIDDPEFLRRHALYGLAFFAAASVPFLKSGFNDREVGKPLDGLGVYGAIALTLFSVFAVLAGYAKDFEWLVIACFGILPRAVFSIIEGIRTNSVSQKK